MALAYAVEPSESTLAATAAFTGMAIEELAGESLPERAAMSLINANIAALINAAVALNALSDHSVAIANAQQTAPIIQHN